MRVAIMQPYFFPYIGYWQLINSADTFVIYDDVHYIKQGYINRNSILINGEKRTITLRVNRASSYSIINSLTVGNNKSKILKSIELSYRNAPNFAQVYPLLKQSILCENNNLARYLAASISDVCRYLGISAQIVLSSELEKNNNLRGQEKVIQICALLGASSYINPIGGINLYDHPSFDKEGIELYFLKTLDMSYRQFTGNFIPNLSIIDVMMFNANEMLRNLLNRYVLIS